MVPDAVLNPRWRLPPYLAERYPYDARFVPVGDGHELAVVDEGPRDGEPVVLLHGNPTWGFLYRHLVPPLVESGYRVIVPDLVGFGRSSKPEDAAYHSVDRHAENLAIVLDAVDARDVTLAVHDWGGPFGLAWAVRHPERVKRLVVMNTTAFPPKRERPFTAWHALFQSPAGPILGRSLNLVVESAMRLGVAKPQRVRGAVLRGYRWPFPTPASRVGPLALVRLVPDGPDHPTADAFRAIEAGLPRLADVPTLILWGTMDPVMPTRAIDKWRERLPGVTDVFRYEDASHFLQEDAYERIVPDLLGFLKST